MQTHKPMQQIWDQQLLEMVNYVLQATEKHFEL